MLDFDKKNLIKKVINPIQHETLSELPARFGHLLAALSILILIQPASQIDQITDIILGVLPKWSVT